MMTITVTIDRPGELSPEVYHFERDCFDPECDPVTRCVDAIGSVRCESLAYDMAEAIDVFLDGIEAMRGDDVGLGRPLRGVVR